MLNAQNIGTLGKEKPVRLSGGLGLGTWIYNTSGIPGRQSPYSWYITGSPTLSLYGVTFPVSFTVSEQQRDYSQPFNQYGVSPYYKWITLHAGYRNLYFSDYTLAGATLLGAGLELNPGLLRIGFVYGRFRRAIGLEHNIDDENRPLLPSYKRTGYAAKIGIGRKSKYLDLIFLKGSDDTSSLKTNLDVARIYPQENAVLGLRGFFSFKKKLTLEVDAAASGWTRDVRAPGFDTLDNALRSVDQILPLNISTVALFAGRASASYQFSRGGIKVGYKRVEPDFHSFGAYYFQTDIEEFSIAPSFRLFKSRLAVYASAGLQRDNLMRKKLARTTRNIYSVNLSLNPSAAWGINANYANYGMTQQKGLIEPNDSVRMSLVNQSAGFSLRLGKANQHHSRQFMLFGNYFNTQDRNEFTSIFVNARSLVGNLSYQLSWLKSKWSLSAAIAFSNFKTAQRNINSMGPVLGISKSFFKGRMRTSLSANSQWRTLDGGQDGSLVNTNLNISYSIRKNQQIAILAYLTHNTSSSATYYASFNENKISLRYGYNF